MPSRFKDPFIKIISTFFGIGFLPIAPGTFASLAGLGIFFLVHSNPFIYAVFLAGILALGFMVSGEAEAVFKKKDPGCVVIDEVAGMLLCFIFIPCDARLIIAGFLIFRLLDIIKPYPAYQLQQLKGAAGIMWDDIAVALYTNIVLQVAVKLLSYKIS